MSKWHWLFHQLTRQLGFRISLFAILAVFSALVSIVLKPFIPESIGEIIGVGAVDNILNILASSMLAVTTFSLSIMVAAYATAASSVTPRATRLMIEDSVTQNVLATFLGAFLFSLVGIVARSMGAYGERGRVILFITTLVVIVLMIIMLLRWIQHLALLGRVSHTTSRVEEATQLALKDRVSVPYLGANPWQTPPDTALAIYSQEIGYIQNIDVAALEEWAQEQGSEVYLPCLPGAFIHPAQPVAWLKSTERVIDAADVLDAFTFHSERSFDQDPRFGFSVLAEIASRALSPAVNDPGTAIDVLGRSVRLLAILGSQPQASPEILHPHLYVKPLQIADLFDDIFNPIARDGASLIEVQLRLAKCLNALAQMHHELFAADAKRYLTVIQTWAETRMELPADRQRLLAWIHKTGLLA